jgi:hypothetical protein
MKSKKIMVASGCSFTFEPWNWPTFVVNELDLDLLNVGMASTGNGLISKKVIYNVNELLKTYRPEDIIVGVMWSGIDRVDFYSEDNREMSNINGWIQNPTTVVKGCNNWEIGNFMWKTTKSKLWYEHFHTHTGSLIQTIQNILTTQWYLEKHGVKYFMSTYLDIFNNDLIKGLLNKPDVRYLYEMINFENFLPVSGCHEWVARNCGDLAFNKPDENGNVGMHPTEYGHKQFAKDVIVPFIKNNNLIDLNNNFPQKKINLI